MMAARALLLLAVGLPFGASAQVSPSGGDASVRSSRRHEGDLALLDKYLAAGDLAAAAALLSRLEPELDADERFALDTAYCLLRHRRFPEARAQWNRVARRVQESVRTASSQTVAPAPDLQARVAEALFVQGLLTAHDGQKDEALRLLRQADGYGFPPLDSPLMVLAADCLYELQEPVLATQAYQEVLKHAPEKVEARLRLGISLYSAGQLGAAKKELEQVLRQAPGMPQAHYHLGAVLFEQKRSDEAQAHLKRELARDARCFACMAKLAHIAYLNGDDRQCESWLAQAAALDATHLETNLVFGMLENRTDRYDQAIRHLSRVVEQSPGYIKAQYQLALAFQRSGNALRAREHLEIYNRLIQEQKAKSIGVPGAE